MRSAILSAPLLLILLSACSSEDGEEATPNETEELNVLTFENALTVQNQSPSDMESVAIASITLDAPGFIVVREASQGFPGKAIGTLYVAESGQNITVPLTRRVEFGETLFATLHVDSNTNKTFDFETSPGVDSPALGVDALPVSEAFMIGDPDASEIIAADQSVEADVWATSARVELVTTTTLDAFVALHASPDDLTDPVGFAPLDAFTTRDLEITLIKPVPHNTALHVVLHEDLGVPGSFEPAGTDLPLDDERASFVISLDPAPSASLACTLTTEACSELIKTLPVDLTFEANHAGHILIEYTSAADEPQKLLVPVTPEMTSLSEVELPEPACVTTFQATLLVDVEGVDPLTTESLLPVATDADGAQATCSVETLPEDLGALVTRVSSDPADTLTFDVAISGLGLLENKAAFVAIYDADDTLLSTTRYTESTQEDVTVDLGRVLVRGEQLVFRAFSDEGTLETLDDEDPAIIGPSGAPLEESVTIEELGTSKPSLTVLAQDVNDPAAQLTIRQSILDGGGFIVVTQDDNGTSGDVLGALATSGVVQDVVIALDRDLVAGETVYITLHTDDGDMMFEGSTDLAEDGTQVTLTLNAGL